MELIHVKGQTYYVEGRQLMPIYRIDEARCILMDPGRKNEREDLEEVLAKHGLTPVGVMITHLHYDHHENTSYFKRNYGAKVAMARQDAELCRDRTALRNHLYTFTPGMLDSVERLRDMICEVDYQIMPEETSINFCGVDFGIIHAPGHSPSNICIVTPDDVCFAGDVYMTEEDLAAASIPFVFDLEADIQSKKRLAETKHALYLFSHQGVRPASALAALCEGNLGLINRVLDLFVEKIPQPQSLCQIYASMNQALGMADGHPVRAFYLERYLRPYLDYLVDVNRLVAADGQGAPTLARVERAM